MCTVAPVTNVQHAVGQPCARCNASANRSNEGTGVPEATTGSAPNASASTVTRPAAGRDGAGRGWLLGTLLAATALGTISNNIVNVPLRRITADLGVPVTQGVLIASASVLVLSVAMPLTGWVSDRLGRRRTLVLALLILSTGTLGAALAPNLGLMVVSRALQGLGWGAANGIGQAIGPPIGGFVADAFGWRAIFGGLVPITLGVLVLTMRVVPRDSGHDTRMDWTGAGSITVGVALLMTAATAAPQPGVPGWLPALGAVLGVVALVVFVLTGLRSPAPFIDPRLLVEMRWLRSATGVFVQQGSLAAVLVAVPLYLTGVVGVSASLTGLLV